MNCNCSNLCDLRYLQEKVIQAFCYQTLFWSFTVWINYSNFWENFWKFSAFSLEFQKFSPKVEQFFLTVGQKNSDNKIIFFQLTLTNRIMQIRLFFERWLWNFEIGTFIKLQPIFVKFICTVCPLLDQISIFDIS